MPKKKSARRRKAFSPQARVIVWIDVLDHLPDDEITVLGYVGNGEMELVAYDSSSPDATGNCWFLAGTLGAPATVFFWADLPELPDFHAVKGGAK
jgi:hypothetical protein